MKKIDPVEGTRIRLFLSGTIEFAFFGHLAMRLELTPVEKFGGISTDGVRITYDSRWFASLPEEIQSFLVAKVIVHCCLGHHERAKGKNHVLWTLATNLEVNCILNKTSLWPRLPVDARPILPGEGPLSWLPPDKTAEFYYEALQDEMEKFQQMGFSGPGDAQGTGDPAGSGGQDYSENDKKLFSELLFVMVSSLAEGSSSMYSQAGWKTAAAAARRDLKSRGTLPGGLSELIEKPIPTGINYLTLLSEFLIKKSSGDYVNWSKPNRRAMSIGMYFPTTNQHILRLVVIFADTSGSMDSSTELRMCVDVIESILALNPCEVYIVEHDAAVQHVRIWIPGEEPLHRCFRGRGGTSHVPAWEWMKKEGLQPDVVIAITDGYTEWGEDPEVPVIWILTPAATAMDPPFGMCVRIPRSKERDA